MVLIAFEKLDPYSWPDPRMFFCQFYKNNLWEFGNNLTQKNNLIFCSDFRKGRIKQNRSLI
jgi:hypothetical protein